MGIFKSKRQPNRAEGGKTIIAEGCKISGEVTELKGSLHIDGYVEGVIDSEFDVSIGVSGQVTGLVKARSIVLSGTLEGKVACEKIDILRTGKLIGELISGELTVETGGKFIGQSHEMTEGGMVVSLPETFAQLNRTNKQNNGNQKTIESKNVETKDIDSEDAEPLLES